MDSGESSCGGVSSSSSMNEKPVLVRVKRKSFQAPLEAFWLEINERPLKRPLLDLKSLSISDSTDREDLKSKKLLVQHVETFDNSKDAKDVLHLFVPESDNAKGLKKMLEERRHMFKQKQGHLRSISRQKHEDLAKSARFEQIWKSRKGNKETIHDDGFIHEFCHLYDIKRVDVEGKSSNDLLMKGQEKGDASLDDYDQILCNCLPMIREFLPDAASEIESELSVSSKEDDYVYDLYTVEEDLNMTDEYASAKYPLVLVEDEEDYYDGPLESDYETDDSNDENNPRNDYPEESSENEDFKSSISSNRSEKSDSQDEEEEEDGDYHVEHYSKWGYR